MVRGVFRFRGRKEGDRDAGVILTKQQHELVAEESALLDRLTAILVEYPATVEDREAVEDAKERLSALFLLVIVGEFNAGKSAFINALIGADVMPEGVLPTTSVINLLKAGETVSEKMLPEGVIERTFPSAFLEDITVVDTPGTNAIIREHETLTQRFVPRADMVLFVTSADRPFTESERSFMASIREWGKKIVIIVNKIDLVPNDESVKQIEAFVRENVERLLGFTPEVFPVAALLAQQAKAIAEKNPGERDRLWNASRFEALERYIVETLDEEGRIRLKLLSPLGIAEHLTERYLKDATDRLEVLRGDLQTIDNIERQLAVYQEDMRRQFEYHLTRIENIIARMVTRGDDFFEETIRIGRIFDLVRTDRIKNEFEQKVVADTEKRIDATIDELIDWMVEQDLRTWEAVTDYIDRRRISKYEDELIGEIGSQFRYDRRALLESVSKRAMEEVERHDPEREAHELSLSVRNAVAAVAITEAGAVGLGALVVAAASTVAVDVTGILAASVLAGIGLFVLPRRRRMARNEFRVRAEELETRLLEVMRDQFEHELERSVGRIRDAIAPYTRFVKSQQEKLTRMSASLTEIGEDLRGFRHRIGGDEDTPLDLALRDIPEAQDRITPSQAPAASGTALPEQDAMASLPASTSSPATNGTGADEDEDWEDEIDPDEEAEGAARSPERATDI